MRLLLISCFLLLGVWAPSANADTIEVILRPAIRLLDTVCNRLKQDCDTELVERIRQLGQAPSKAACLDSSSQAQENIIMVRLPFKCEGSVNLPCDAGQQQSITGQVVNLIGCTVRNLPRALVGAAGNVKISKIRHVVCAVLILAHTSLELVSNVLCQLTLRNVTFALPGVVLILLIAVIRALASLSVFLKILLTILFPVLLVVVIVVMVLLVVVWFVTYLPTGLLDGLRVMPMIQMIAQALSHALMGPLETRKCGECDRALSALGAELRDAIKFVLPSTVIASFRSGSGILSKGTNVVRGILRGVVGLPRSILEILSGGRNTLKVCLK